MRWLTIFLAACLAAGAGYYYWLQQAEAKLDIQTVAATRADVRRAVSTSGTVRALGTVDIGSQLSGNIGELNVDFTSEVKKGQVLARIEPSTFETKVREEEAGLAIAKANVDLQASHRRAGGIESAQGRARLAPRPGTRHQRRRHASHARRGNRRRSRAPPPSSPSPKPMSKTPKRRWLSIRRPSTAPASIWSAPISARRSTAWSSTVRSRSGRPLQRASRRRSCSPSPRTYPMCRSKPR